MNSYKVVAEKHDGSKVNFRAQFNPSAMHDLASLHGVDVKEAVIEAFMSAIAVEISTTKLYPPNLKALHFVEE